MTPASMLVARNVREDIGTGFVAALLLATAFLVAYLAAAGLPADAADGVLTASPPTHPPGADARATDGDFTGAPVYRLPSVTVVGHREGVADTLAGEPASRSPHEARAKGAPRA